MTTWAPPIDESSIFSNGIVVGTVDLNFSDGRKTVVERPCVRSTVSSGNRCPTHPSSGVKSVVNTIRLRKTEFPDKKRFPNHRLARRQPSCDDHNQEGLQHPSRRHFARNHMTEHLPIECGKGQADNNGNNSQNAGNSESGAAQRSLPRSTVRQ